MQGNGGPTFTYLPVAASPAVNKGNNAGAPAFDQRGITRPQGTKVDIGAVEVAIKPADVQVTLSAPSQVKRGRNFTFTLTVKNLGPDTATNVSLQELLDANAAVIAAVPSKGSFSVTTGLLTWTIGTLKKNASATIKITLRPIHVGSLELDATVAAAEDANSSNNRAKKTLAVVERLRISLWLPDLRGRAA